MLGAFLMFSKNCFVRSFFYLVSSFISANAVKSIIIMLARTRLKPNGSNIYHILYMLA
jgi:hypothetical protein